MYFEEVVLEYAVISGSMLPRRGTSPGCRWRVAANMLTLQPTRTTTKMSPAVTQHPLAVPVGWGVPEWGGVTKQTAV